MEFLLGVEYVYVCLYVYVCVYIHTHTHNGIYTCVCTYIHSGILLTHKKENLPFVTTWVNLECIALSNVNQRKTNIT